MFFVFPCVLGTTPLIPIVVRPVKLITKSVTLLTMSDILFAPSALCLSPANPGYIAVIGSGPCIPLINWLAASTSVFIGAIPALSVNSVGICSTGKGIIKPIPTNPFPLISK